VLATTAVGGLTVRVLVDALPARDGGGATYVRQQMHALARVAPDVDIRMLVSPWSEVGAVPVQVEIARVGSVPMRFAYEQTRLPTRRADVIYCPLNFGPVLAKSPVVLTVQNAIYYGEGLRLPEVAPFRPLSKVKANHWAMRRADAVVAISRSLADQVLETLPSVEHKLRVIYNGQAEWPIVAAPVDGLSGPFFLSVANAAPHKRVEDVVTAWANLPRRVGAGVALVLAGRYSEEEVRLHNQLAGNRADLLVHTGAVRDRAQVRWLYENAIALVSMSLLESFPMTPNEAASLGCRLILSDIPVHHEVSPPSTTFVPIRDVSSLRDVLAEAAGDPARTDAWVWHTSWDKNAHAFHDLFHAVCRR
jgi:glycosyltransferase involved in cell wall biosynthesis